MAGVWGPYAGVVDRVVDGDSVHVRLHVEQDIGFDVVLRANIYARVRLVTVDGRFIDAPEMRSPTYEEGKAARNYLASLLAAGDPVQVLSYGWDKYGGRIDGSIELMRGRVDVAVKMVDAGHAVYA